MTDTVESIIVAFLEAHKDWWDEDETFDLAYSIVKALYPQKIGENFRMDLECITADVLETLNDRVDSKSERRHIRAISETIVENLKNEWDRNEARKLLRAARRQRF